MNVAAGGTLVQDIPLEIYEKNTAEKILNMDENSRHRNYYSGFKIYPDIKSAYPHQLQLISGRWLSLINTGLRFRSLNKKAAKFILSGFRNYINTVILFF
ncbi:MAG: hypothetical protein KAS71_03470 [Bacteroidales bacterium]|nr:hypothetical protein [Bacteroidales bacterium]